MSETYSCWKCGGPLPDVPLPLARHEECPHCRAQLHVCRMCVFFDTTVAQQCREPVAESVSDKQRANFCGYFRINPQAFVNSPDRGAASRSQLDALFGGGASTDAAEARDGGCGEHDPLEQLFRK